METSLNNNFEYKFINRKYNKNIDEKHTRKSNTHNHESTIKNKHHTGFK